MAKRLKGENHLGFGHLMLWKSSEFSSAWVNLIIMQYLTIYASDILGLNVALVGTLLLASKIFDAITDFIAGWMVDNTKSKLGKGRPYEICIVGQTICTILLFCADPAWQTVVKCIWVVSMYSLACAVFGTLRNAGQNVYTIRHFKNNRDLISKQSAYGSIIVMAASIAVSVAFPMMMATLGTSSGGWRTMITIIMIPATLIGALRFIFCKEYTEDEDTAEKTDFKAMFSMLKGNRFLWFYCIAFFGYSMMTNLSVGSYYYTYVIGNIGLAGAMSALSVIVLPVMAVIPWLLKKIGSLGKMIFLTSWIGVAGYVICWFANASIVGVFAGMMLGTLGTLPIMYYGSIFIMDICSYNEMKGMPRMEGTASAISNFISKFGSAVGSWVTGILLMLGGYVSSVSDEVVQQPDSAIFMIRVVFCFVPLLCTLLIGFACKGFSKVEPIVEDYERTGKSEIAATAE